ncbi:hypothetical protein [Streptomyces sp. SD15]
MSSRPCPKSPHAVTVHGADLDDARVRAAIVEAGFGVGEPAAA